MNNWGGLRLRWNTHGYLQFCLGHLKYKQQVNESAQLKGPLT